MTAIRFLLSSDPARLKIEMDQAHSATVEAEYGDGVVMGSILTMAHHGPRAGQLAPCAYPNGCAWGVEVVGVSHIDLDTVGGCMAILGIKPEADAFWRLAEFNDLNGPHKLVHSGASTYDLRQLYAWFAWEQDHRVQASADGSVTEVTEVVLAAAQAVERIVSGDEDMLKAGDAYQANETKLNAASFIEHKGGVIVRVYAGRVNYLYTDPLGNTGLAIVAYRPDSGGITVSFADAPKGKSASQILQALWEGSGGHAAVAGSPRGRVMTLDDLVAARDATAKAVAEAYGG